LTWGKEDAIRSTADDAALAKLLCVERDYYDDPSLHAISVGGLVYGGGNGGNRKRVAAAMRTTTSGDTESAMPRPPPSSL
jgi:hypothetical protein